MRRTKGTAHFLVTDSLPKTTPMGFEPTRAEHNGLAGRRLNHSATVSHGFARSGFVLDESSVNTVAKNR